MNKEPMKMQTLMYQLKSALLSILILTGFFQAIANAQSPPEAEWIKIELGTSYELQVDGPEARQRIPVKLLSNAQWDRVSFHLVDVSIGAQHDAKVFEAFKIIKGDANDRQTPSLEIVVSTQSLRQGTYNVTVEAQAMSASSTTTTKENESQQLKFQIICPSAKLQSLPTLYIEQVQYLPFLSPSISYNVLPVREVGGHSWMTNVQISQFNISKGPDLSSSGRINFNSHDLEVHARNEALATYTLAHPFPLGTTISVAQIDASQLAEPVSFNFEVQARLHRWFILLFIVLGFASGYFVRIWLQRRIELDETIQKGTALYGRIKQETERHQDSKFVDALQAELTNADNSLSSQEASKITEAINKANEILTTELADLANRRISLLNRFKTMLDLTKTAWSLPENLAIEMRKTDERVENARLQFHSSSDNVGAADNELEKIHKDMASALSSSILNWQAAIDGYFNDLTTPRIPLPTAIAQNMTVATNKIKAQAEQVSEINPNATLDEISNALNAIHQVSGRLRSFILYLPQWLQRPLADMTGILSQISLPDRDAIKQLQTKLDEFTAGLEASASTPDLALRKLPAELKNLHESWSKALMGLITNAPEKDRLAVENMLKNYEYADAAAEVVRLVQQLKQARLLDGKAKTAAPNVIRLSSPVPAWIAPEQITLQRPTLISDAQTNESLSPIEKLRARTFRDLLINRWVQNLIIGVGIIVIGYAIFSEKFVGTVQDLAAVYFWGFGIDLSVSTIVASSSKLKIT